MKVLLYGSKGWIGNQFIEILKKKYIVYILGKSRVDNYKSLKEEILEHNPTHIVSFIGRTHGKINEKIFTTIDYLEQEGKLVENIRDNLYAPLLLSTISKERNIHLTYLGTGCIFKFDDTHPFGLETNGFSENDEPNFFGSSYSIVKGYTDKIMKLFNDSVLNLRIRMPITDQQNCRNFITKITTYDKICSVPNSMTVLPELLPKVLEMMNNNLVGTINLTNPGLISHNEILDMFKEIVDPTFTYKNFSIEDQKKILAADRSNNYLDTTKLETLFPDIKPIKASIRDILLKYKGTYIPKIIPDLNKKHIDIPQENISCLFITGGCGFIGSNFINYYCKNNPDLKVINFDALYYCADINNVSKEIRNSDNYIFIEGNLQSYDLLKYIFKTNKISHVIHFAAQSHVQTSFTDSIRYTQDNILGTHNLLEVNRLYNPSLKKFIHVSTDEVYGESMNSVDETHKTEHSILCPTNPYAATKAGAELIAQSYCHSFKMPIIITRGNNVYGPNQYPEKLIPKFIKQLKNNEKVTIQGDGSTVRAFLHAYDTARAFECILKKGNNGEIYNIGCDEGMEYSVMDVAKMLIRMIKDTDDYDNWITYIQDRPYNDERYYISNQKLRDLGWYIQINFEDGLQEMVHGEYKINKDYLITINNRNDYNKYFGDWINNIDELKDKYIGALPFEHIRIDNFLKDEYAEEIFKNFPTDFENWHKYYNPIEVKYANDNINSFDNSIKDLFYLLSTDNLINVFSEITGITDLEYDPYLHGAGLHAHPRYGRLNMHLDYEKHILLQNKQRRLNIILFLTKDWKEEWNGDNQLWDKDMKECVVKTYPKFNSAILFKTDEITWHGLPEKIMCPEGVFRKSLAYYYISPLINKENKNKIGNDGSGYRTKATFVKRPIDPEYPELEKLYEIRPHRRIENKDMDDIWPDWNPEIL
uniref:GDP-mannose 4,6 dehydratase n=1 Tax=Megaviridae environmental sample TaxID=1737588 RepID=A0A5J6VKL8_9VIRU|nr:MAG: GDP-mannose 4,6 dehydratase [Megaviridae environmental sample]